MYLNFTLVVLLNSLYIFAPHQQFNDSAIKGNWLYHAKCKGNLHILNILDQHTWYLRKWVKGNGLEIGLSM